MFHFSISDLPTLLLRAIVILFSLTVHEVSHGYMAYRLGDPTARNLGRLSLNPLKHLDPIGVVCMLLFRFGWAKPVPINPRNFKHNRRDTALTALAGPLSNFALALIGVLLYRIAYVVLANSMMTVSAFRANVIMLLMNFFLEFILINLSFGVFNLIPIPPLDGSRIFLVFLPAKYYFAVRKYERYLMIALLVLLWFGLLTKPLSFLVQLIFSGMNRLVGLIPFL